MKKIICILLSMFLLGSTSFAQDKDAKKPTKKAPVAAGTSSATPKQDKTPNQARPAGKPVKASAAAAPQAAPVATERPAAASKMKKDGTPDMRTKENKAKGKPAAGPMKKDGTPDMRYKANKDAAAQKK